MKWTLFRLFLTLALASSSASAALIYQADFSVAGQGSTHDNSGNDPFETSPVAGANWQLSFPTPSSDGSTNKFITENGAMVVDDWGGEGTITGDAVTVPTDGTITVAGVGTGGDFNATAEFFNWFYIVNSGTPVTFGTTFGNPTANGTVFDGSLSGIPVSAGDTVQVGFTINVNGSSDGATVTALTIDHAPVPEPAGFALLFVALLGCVGLLRRK